MPAQNQGQVDPNRAVELVGIATEIAFRAGVPERQLKERINSSLQQSGYPTNPKDFWTSPDTMRG